MTEARRGATPPERPASPSPSPSPSLRLQRLFARYARRYLRKSFHALRVRDLRRLEVPDEVPIVVFMNHASWWDPIVGAVLTHRLAPTRRAYSPIDADALRRYRFFARLGFFGVTQGRLRGAREFLVTARRLCARERSVLWLTPQGRFSDVRERPPSLAPGLGHLAARLDAAVFLPIAVEYCFWEERLPEVLVLAGETIVSDGTIGPKGPKEWTEHFAAALASTQDQLALLSRERRVDQFDVLVEGRAGVGFVYDAWRGLRAALTGQRFRRRHGDCDR